MEKGKCDAESSTWMTICKASYPKNVSVDKLRECHVDAEQALDLDGSFQCLGLRILEDGGEAKAVFLQGIRIWIWN